jgi:transposase
MASPKIVFIKENLEELKKLFKKADPLIQPRIKMLIEIKKHHSDGISKRALAETVGVNHNSIQTWRGKYEEGGLKLLCSHKMIGYKPEILDPKQHDAIKKKLSDPQNGLQGYKELWVWVERTFGIKIKYDTLAKYCRRNFGTKIKVARKSHVNKDGKEVLTFKKTLVISAENALEIK